MDAEIEDAESNDATKKDKASSGNKDAERALLRLKQKLQVIILNSFSFFVYFFISFSFYSLYDELFIK